MMDTPDSDSHDQGLEPLPRQSGKQIKSWITISKVYPPDDIVIESMLKFYGIPVRISRREIPQLPFSTGPLAEVIIAVPEEMVEEARDLLESENAGK
ncbi:MAG: hypothetical protein PHP26_06365 [Syntrophomonas sp.]|uniref:hypothetical protein n=1 Tax=Syntrophomonas sp. TaxID=2053627 RepID=UPI00260DEE68|nr:hypothetical protein [Syntrophomonas sp.]MDD2510618.1 hypothetical protein [Syntrophomonas sp.]MDD3879597.1 hypothetical protein [Syntrophomonas sp.]MDD4626748.1 hypothetical protein [Syntrophomonas sp.]